MGGLYFEFVFCRALFLIITIANVTFCLFVCLLAVCFSLMISGFFLEYITKVLKAAALRTKKTRLNGYLHVFWQQEYVTVILSNVSTFLLVAIYVRLYFCHDALLITEWQSYLASRHIKQGFFFLLEAKFDVM